MVLSVLYLTGYTLLPISFVLFLALFINTVLSWQRDRVSEEQSTITVEEDTDSVVQTV